MSKKILGDSPAVKELLSMINRVSGSKTNILVVGESGTGKELVARMIHDSGAFKGKPFVPVNCGAIPENLIESELFGHKKGSFTGAVNDKLGLFEVANGGTLFLDEVGELPLAMQVKLLRAIQERTIRKVGGNDDLKVDARIIAATNRDLEAGVAAGTFREDLYYRLNVILIRTPPLRERRSDIPLLVSHFIDRYTEKQGKKITAIEPEAMAVLEGYEWPGNIRELENLIERAVTMENGKKITVQSLPEEFAARFARHEMSRTPIKGTGASLGTSVLQVPAPDFVGGKKVDLEKILGEIEHAYLKAALEHTGGVKKKAAALLGITFRSIRYRLKKHGEDTEE